MVTEFEDCDVVGTRMKRIAIARRGFKTDFFILADFSFVHINNLAKTQSRKVISPFLSFEMTNST
jgi:hypothetical protein